MKLTTKGKFAITALLDMAMYSNDTPLNLCTIGKRQSISVSYLEQLFVKLRRCGVVKSHKGPGGGYVLAHKADQIKLSTIIKAVDEDMDARTCHGLKNCHSSKGKCLTHDLWNGLTTHVYRYLDGITLFDLIPKNAINAELVFQHPVTITAQQG